MSISVQGYPKSCPVVNGLVSSSSQTQKSVFFHPRKAVLGGRFWTKTIFLAKRSTFANSMPNSTAKAKRCTPDIIEQTLTALAYYICRRWKLKTFYLWSPGLTSFNIFVRYGLLSNTIRSMIAVMQWITCFVLTDSKGDPLSNWGSSAALTLPSWDTPVKSYCRK